jgi:cytidylate kinase
MEARVVCLSRTLGAGGEVIGHQVAAGLGFRYLDEEIISRAAGEAHVDADAAAAAEHNPPLLRRLLDRLSSAAAMVAAPSILGTGGPLKAPGPELSPYLSTATELRPLIRAAIFEAATAGRAVIVAHAASIALAGTAGVLRVLVTASPGTRAERLAALQGIPLDAARAAVADSDRERREYFRDFYDLGEELPTHYDLVLNTDTLTSDLVVALVLEAAKNLPEV